MIGFSAGAAGAINAAEAVPSADSTANSLVRDALGNKTDTALAGDPTATASIVAMLKQLINVLQGTDGIATFPAAAAPANGVSMAEVLREIFTTSVGRQVFRSAPQATVVVNDVAANVSLPSVVVTIPAGKSIAAVWAVVQWRKQVESSGSANAVNVAQQIQVQNSVGGTWTNAITIPDNSLATDASATEGGDSLAGDGDLSAEVTASGTYSFRWQNADVDGASLTFHEWQCFLVVEYA